MEEREGEKGNKKFLLIGIIFIFVIGGFWIVNEVDYSKVGGKIIGMKEKVVSTLEFGESTIKVDKEVSNVTTAGDLSGAEGTVINLVMIFVVLGVMMAIVGTIVSNFSRSGIL